MSKDIWHSAVEIPVFDDTVVFIDDLNNWHTGYTQRDVDMPERKIKRNIALMQSRKKHIKITEQKDK